MTRQRAIIRALAKFGTYAPIDRADKQACLRMADRGILLRMWQGHQPVYMLSPTFIEKYKKTLDARV